MTSGQSDIAASRRARRLAFAGTPDFAAVVLAGLLSAGFTFQRVYTQPDRPFGRGRKIEPTPVKRLALEHGLDVQTPDRLDPPDVVAGLRALSLDALIVAAYGVILRKPILDAPRRGCLNVHASLLPRWRGAAPIERAMIEGDDPIGVTIMQMDEGVDTGAILRQEPCPLAADATGDDAHRALGELGTRVLIACLDELDRLKPVPQPAEGATRARKLTPKDSRLDWQLPASQLARRILALNSRQPVAAYINGKRAQLLRASARSDSGEVPGTIIARDHSGIDVACGERTVLRITELQLQGKARMPLDALLRGNAALFAPGNRWQSDAPGN